MTRDAVGLGVGLGALGLASAFALLVDAGPAEAQAGSSELTIEVSETCLPEGWSAQAVQHQLDVELADARRDPALPPPPPLRLRALACGDADHFVLEAIEPEEGAAREIALDAVPASLRLRALAMIAAEVARSVLRGEPLATPTAPEAAPEPEPEAALAPAEPALASVVLGTPRSPPRPDERAQALGSPQIPPRRPRFVLAASLPVVLVEGPVVGVGGGIEARWIVPTFVDLSLVLAPRILDAHASSSLGEVSLAAVDIALGAALGGRLGPLLVGGGVGLSVGWARLEGHPIDARAIGHARESTTWLLPVWVDLALVLDPFWIGLRIGADVALSASQALVLGDVTLSQAPVSGSATASFGVTLPF